VKHIYENLLAIKDVSEQLQGLLLQDDMDLIFQKINERQALLDKLQDFLSASDIRSRKSLNSEIQTLIKSIFALDQKNAEEVKARISDLSNSLSALGKEKQTLKQLRSENKVRRKQIVDFLH